MITHFESEISVCVCVVCSLLLSMCYKLLENPGFVREKTARDKVFGLMGSLNKRLNISPRRPILRCFTLASPIYLRDTLNWPINTGVLLI